MFIIPGRLLARAKHIPLHQSVELKSYSTLYVRRDQLDPLLPHATSSKTFGTHRRQLLPSPSSSLTQNHRHFFDWTKKFNLYWLLGPPPKPGTPESIDRSLNFGVLFCIYIMVLTFIGHQTGHITFQKDYYSLKKKEADLLKEKEKEEYEKALELAKLRMTPLKDSNE